MPRRSRLKLPPAILPDRAHLPLLQALAVTIAKLLPHHMRFTLVTFNAMGKVQDYISSHAPARRTKPRKTWRRRHT
jgi:hypothetical protein